jgi:hypothetical protein
MFELKKIWRHQGAVNEKRGKGRVFKRSGQILRCA